MRYYEAYFQLLTDKEVCVTDVDSIVLFWAFRIQSSGRRLWECVGPVVRADHFPAGLTFSRGTFLRECLNRG
jgi:hypothetical protein